MTEPIISELFNSAMATDADRRRYAQNSLIVDTAIAINKALETAQVSQKDLAGRLGRSEGYVSQVLSGGGNLTLRTLADFAHGLGFVVDIAFRAASSASGCDSRPSWHSVNKVESPRETHAADSQYALAA